MQNPRHLSSDQPTADESAIAKARGVQISFPVGEANQKFRAIFMSLITQDGFGMPFVCTVMSTFRRARKLETMVLQFRLVSAEVYSYTCG